MGVPSMPELLIILTIVVLLFGAKKIPDLAAGIGKGIKNFKKAVKEDDKIESKEEETTVASSEAKKEEPQSSENIEADKSTNKA